MATERCVIRFIYLLDCYVKLAVFSEDVLLHHGGSNADLIVFRLERRHGEQQQQ